MRQMRSIREGSVRARRVAARALVLLAAALVATAAHAQEVTINASAGDQFDPHVSGDWAVYTSDLSIRYYRFSTGVDAAIPMGSSARDLLSDISGSRIVFSRTITGVKTAIMFFDAAIGDAPIEIDPRATGTRLGSAIGGDTIAYIDQALHHTASWSFTTWSPPPHSGSPTTRHSTAIPTSRRAATSSSGSTV